MTDEKKALVFSYEYLRNDVNLTEVAEMLLRKAQIPQEMLGRLPSLEDVWSCYSSGTTGRKRKGTVEGRNGPSTSVAPKRKKPSVDGTDVEDNNMSEMGPSTSSANGGPQQTAATTAPDVTVGFRQLQSTVASNISQFLTEHLNERLSMERLLAEKDGEILDLEMRLKKKSKKIRKMRDALKQFKQSFEKVAQALDDMDW